MEFGEVGAHDPEIDQRNSSVKLDSSWNAMLRFVWSGRQILTNHFWYVSWCGLYWLSSATAWVIKEQNTLKCRLHSQDIYPSYFSLKQPQLYQNLLTALEIASSGSICSHVSIYVKAWPDTQLHPMAALVFHICRSRTIRRPLAAALVWNLSCLK